MVYHQLCRLFFIGLSFLTLSVTSASAQNQSGMVDRLDKLERDLQMLQRNYYRDGGPAATETPVKTNIPVAGAAVSISVPSPRSGGLIMIGGSNSRATRTVLADENGYFRAAGLKSGKARVCGSSAGNARLAARHSRTRPS